MTQVTQSHVPSAEKAGLKYWMDRVLAEHSKLSPELPPDRVHDLRVALRRCILISELMRDLDPGGDWKGMRKAGKRLFRPLGAVRDTQVLGEWVEKLAPPAGDSTTALLDLLKAREDQDRQTAQEAVRDFDRKEWRSWERQLTGRFRYVASDRAACESLVLELWQAVRDLHRRAQRSGSRIAYHRLRIALKKFRYAVENFLPSLYSGWEPDLKFLQDLLGEIHDLSVLAQIIVRNRRLSDKALHTWWTAKLREECGKRIRRYRQKMAGKASPLWLWREALPQERELRSSALARLAAWGHFVVPDFPRARRVAAFAMQLYDGFSRVGLIGNDSKPEERSVLHAAALLEKAGRFRKGRAYHKESYRMIRRIPPPPGWFARDLELTALIARFHRRALPRPDHKALRAYPLPVRQSVVVLAAILRLANAFAAKQYQAVRRLDVESVSGVIIIRAEGYVETDPLASKLSVAKRLVEFACQHPVHILPPGARPLAPKVVQRSARSDAA